MILFKYENEDPSFQLEEGFYILDFTYPEFKPERCVAEWSNGSWYRTGADYDPWQYDLKPPKIEVVARIDTEKLFIIEVAP